jgi:hypothetical protein
VPIPAEAARIITSRPIRPLAAVATPVTAASAWTSGSARRMVLPAGLIRPSSAQRGPAATLPSTRTIQPSGSSAETVRETIETWISLRRARSLIVIGP